MPMLSFDSTILLGCSCARSLEHYPIFKKIFFHANKFCSIIASYGFDLLIILAFHHRKKIVSVLDTSFLSISKEIQTGREQSSTIVRKYEAPQEEGVLYAPHKSQCIKSNMSEACLLLNGNVSLVCLAL